MSTTSRIDVVVVGGGIAGLTAAALLAQAGKRVVLLERSHALGGRGATTDKGGYHLNFGPHAWYVAGPGTRVLEGLGIPLAGSPPRPSATFALARGRLHTMPIGFVSLLTTDLLGLPGKVALARVLATIGGMDTHEYDTVPLSDWLSAIADEGARQVTETAIRIAAYTHAPDVLSAGAGLASVQTVVRKGVRYLDGGWQRIVNALAGRARGLGAEILTSSPVAEVLHDREHVEGVRLDDGRVVLAPDVVLAVEPGTVRRLLGDLCRMDVRSLLPSRAACLDVALSTYPNPNVIATFGIDRPLYFAVHSASAKLAPNGGAVIHAAKYLDPLREPDPAADERELEDLMDLLQPGWRDSVITRRFLPHMAVTHAIPTAAGGGLRSRPDTAALGLRGAWLAGDWVGSEGMLGNAAVASAARVARSILDHARPHEAVA